MRRHRRGMMTSPLPWLGQLTLWDAAAFLYLVAMLWGVGWSVRHHPNGWRSAGEMASAYRLLWMRRAARRDVRVTDITLLGILRTGSSFMASMTILALGGAVALLGQFDLLESLAMEIGGGFDAPRSAQQAKLLCLIAILVYAFLKFIWSVRVFGYCAVVMGAMPGDQPADTEEEIEREAARAAELSRIAARNFNEGLRSVYGALAMLAWFLGPLWLFLATTLTGAVLLRREFASETRAALRFGAFRS
ncbi:MAG: DUF599 domain-containing protein [Pseudomonadota bacterium]